uniref:Uncharacterized protein n=1 Tax=Poecilia reticulata TaxID=8081 RepID=A0A3P9PVD7_POERE
MPWFPGLSSSVAQLSNSSLHRMHYEQHLGRHLTCNIFPPWLSIYRLSHSCFLKRLMVLKGTPFRHV